MTKKTQIIRDLLKNARPVVSPGIYDGYSLRLVAAMGFKTAATTGSRLSNSHQVWPKRCGHMRGKDLISTREMCKKIEAAVKAKRDPDFIINARIDAIAVEGIEGAVKRAREYAAAGADMIYPDATRNEDDIERIVEAVPEHPVNINMGFGVRSRPTTPLLPLKRLREPGVARVSCPRMLTAAAISGMRKALEQMKWCIETGEPADRPDLLASMDEITALAGYDAIDQLAQAFALPEDLERRYGGERGYVVKAKD